MTVLHSAAEVLQALAALNLSVSGLADDSRRVQAGDIYLAFRDDIADRRRFVSQAVAQGAVALLWQNDEGKENAAPPSFSVPVILVTNLRQMAGELAHALASYPSERLSLIAITGTNGKTTISQCLGRVYPGPCAVIGTLGAGYVDAMNDTGFTTPEAPQLVRLLSSFVHQRAKACALEASSIGIEEGRLNGAHVDVAVFTNLTRDHLDYHGTLAAYQAAKARLFTWPRLRLAVINADDDFGRQLIRSSTAARVIAYGMSENPQDYRDFPPQVRAEAIVDASRDDGVSVQRFRLLLPNGRVDVETALLGRYNIANLLAVAAVLFDRGLSASEIARALTDLTPPAGRLQQVNDAQDAGKPLVVVDFAHTPDALENALHALRTQAQQRGGRLVVVFGCGGNRDRGKRPQMGRVAEQCADRVLVTSDNPRHENPADIVADIASGMIHAECEIDRKKAIARAVREAAAQDVVLLAGKGHEPYQDVAGEKHPFSDLAEAKNALSAWSGADVNVASHNSSEGNGMDWSLAEMAAVVGGQLLGDNATAVHIHGVNSDSRRPQAGQLFVALRGENFDAHDFLPAVQQAGAAAALVSDGARLPSDFPAIVVADTRLALGLLAQAWRQKMAIPCVAVTGSNGKTTTRDMIAAILRAHFGRDGVLSTSGNFNNDIGLPLTLLALRPHHSAAVIELGMNHPGEIAYLAGLLHANVGVITNAQRAHLEGMGRLESVAAEKGSLYQSLNHNGTAVINARSPFAESWLAQAKTHAPKIFLYGEAGDDAQHETPLQLSAAIVMREGLANLAFTWRRGGNVQNGGAENIEKAEVCLSVFGRHNGENALAAAAAALACGMTLSDVVNGLAAFAGVAGRLQLLAGQDGVRLINDTYNANPDSVRAAIDVLAGFSGRKILLLGDMGEIGEESSRCHAEVGAYAQRQGVDVLLTLGAASRAASDTFAAAANEHASQQKNEHFADDVQGMAARAQQFIHAAAAAQTPCTVLVKGSRFMKMERLVAALRAPAGEDL